MRKCCESCVKHKVSCPVKSCDYWINYKGDMNCSLIAVEKNGSMTLREVADRLKISFVRVKQIQDVALKKLVSGNFDIKKFLTNS
tara:strand:+ start:231 stop:485 length:255 start_codon:yes stop_codon:yes gene_type:complete